MNMKAEKGSSAWMGAVDSRLPLETAHSAHAREAVLPDQDAASAFDVTDGLDLGFMRNLSDEDRGTLARLMARIGERHYRRGFQQGATLQQSDQSMQPEALADWRYGTSTDFSPWGDAPGRAETSLGRLHTENRALLRAGLPEALPGLPNVLLAWPSRRVLG